MTGAPLIEAYGLTETSPAVCINPLNLADYNGSIGLPIPSTELSIRDDENREAGIGQDRVGEICVRGPQVTVSYTHLDVYKRQSLCRRTTLPRSKSPCSRSTFSPLRCNRNAA